jgi:hypothetical protein
MPSWHRKLAPAAAELRARYRKLTRLQHWLILGTGSLIVFFIALHWTVASILGHELVAQVESHLRARMAVGDVSYQFPLGLTVRNCEFSQLQRDGMPRKLLEVKQIHVKLANLPVFGGPLIVEEMTIERPAIHIIRTTGGVAGQSGLVREESGNAAATKPSSKLSDILRLHHVEIQSAQIVYEDQTHPAAPTAAWNDLDLTIDTAPRGPADYAFGLWAQSGDLAELRLEGSFNVDEFTALVKHFDLQVRAGGDQERHLPPQFQEFLDRHRVHGQLQIDGSASAGPAPEQNSCAVTIALAGASAYSPEADAALDDLHLTLHLGAGAQGASMSLSNCSARAGNVTLSVKDGAAIKLDRLSQRWSLGNLDAVLQATPQHVAGRASGVRRFNPGGSMELTAALDGPIGMPIDWSKVDGEALIYPRRMTIQPAGFAAPVSNIDGGPIRLSHGVVALRDMQAKYGVDQLLISSVRLLLPGGDNGGALRCTEINGSLIMRPTGPPLPGLASQGAPRIQVGGEYVFSGRASLDPADQDRPLDCDLLLSCDNGTFAVDWPKVEASQIKFDLEALSDRIDLLQFKCQTFGGTLSAHARMDCQPPYAFSGDVFTRSLNLADIVAAIRKPSSGEGLKLKGLVDIASSVGAQVLPPGASLLDTLHCEGQFEVMQGDLWDIPALQKVQNASDIARKALTVGSAAALFRIANDRIELQDAAVSAPVFGVQGSGTIGFDGQLDLHVVAAPLADWKQKMRGLGTGFADFVGDVQKMLNKTTSKLLYEFVLSGPASDPHLQTVGTPILRDKAAMAMKSMMQPSDNQRPIDMVQGQSK